MQNYSELLRIYISPVPKKKKKKNTDSFRDLVCNSHLTVLDGTYLRKTCFSSVSASARKWCGFTISRLLWRSLVFPPH